MITEIRCKHDMIAAHCSWCLGIDDRPAPGVARDYGSCASCRQTIHPGDLIYRMSPGSKRVVGECCG